MDRFEALPLPQKVVIIFIVLAAVAGGYYFMFVTDTLANIDLAKAKVVQHEKKAQTLAMYEDEAQFQALADEEKEIREQLEANKALLPEEDKIPQLITAIKRQADERGLYILKFKPHEREQDDYVARVPVDMSVQGSYPVLISFFEALAQPGMRMMTVSDIKLKFLPVEDFKQGKDTKTSLADKMLKKGGGGGGQSEDPADQLLAQLDDYKLALDRYEIKAEFTVNAYSYTGKPLSPEERKARKRGRRRR